MDELVSRTYEAGGDLGKIGKGEKSSELLSSLREMETIFQKLDEWMAVLKESSLDSWSLYWERKGDNGDEPELETGQHWPWQCLNDLGIQPPFSQPSWADLGFLKCFPPRINAPRLFYLLLWLHGMWGWRDGSHSPLYVRQDAEVSGYLCEL